MNAQVNPGKVLSFDRDLARGVVEFNGRQHSLSATYFHIGRPTRYPMKGELIDVVLGSLGVVYVRLRRQAAKSGER